MREKTKRLFCSIIERQNWFSVFLRGLFFVVAGFTSSNLFAAEAEQSEVVQICNWVIGLSLALIVFLLILLYLLRRKLQLVKKAVSNLPIQSGICDKEGKILFYQDRKEVLQAPKTLKDLPVELQQEFLGVLPEVFETKVTKTIEFNVFKTRCKVVFSPLPEEVYGHPAVMWVFYDVTELTNAYAERTHMLQLLRNTLYSIEDGVISTNYDGELTLINRAAAKILDITEKDFLGKKFDDNIRLCNSLNESLIDKVIQSGQSSKFHSELSRPDQSIVLLDGLITPIIENQNIVGTVLYFRDTTELTHQEQQLQIALKLAQTADRTKSDFLATINHEFRSSVNVILGYCELLEMNAQSGNDQNIEKIQSEGEHLLLLLNDILDISKENPEGMGLQMAPVNCKALFRELQRIFNRTSEHKRISLNVEMSTQIPIFISDYKALRHILMRLLSYSFTVAESSVIQVDVSWLDRDLLIEITVANKNLMTRESTELSLFKQLSARLNSTLNIIQKRNELQIQFTLKNPELCQDQEIPEIPVLIEKEVKPKKNVVLIVDDIAINLKVLGMMLKKLNIESVPCDTAQKAIDEIEKYTPIAIFMDLWMPDFGGEELARFLKENPLTESIPRFLITADTQLNKNIEDLFLDVLYKPLKLTELEKVLKYIELQNNEKKLVQL